jgi:cytochrome b
MTIFLVAEREVEAGGAQPPASADGTVVSQTVKVWDPLVRLFHWSLVAAFVTAWLTGEELQSLHLAAGYTIVGLLAVRIIWGFVGTTHARFSDFVHRPSAVIGHLLDAARFRARRYLGHNPAGGAMILALMGMLAATCVTGIMMTTDAYWGVGWVEEAHELTANLAIVFVGLHLVGVFAASVEHRENLVKAMVTGRKRRA